MDTARLSSKGQVTIPVNIRRKLGLKAGENVVFIKKSNNVLITSEQEIDASISNGWSNDFVATFSQFSETADDTFIEPDEIPSGNNTAKADFE